MKQVYLFLRSLILPIFEINQTIPKKGKIVDLGCGQGLIAFSLAQTKTRQVLGIDSNELRLPKSFQKNLKFKKGDIIKTNLGKIEGAVISDVLHHLARHDQLKLIKNVFSNLATGGVLVIKEIDKGEFLRSRLSRAWDFLLYPKDKIYFRSANDLKVILIDVGFKSIKISRPCRFFPGSTTLFVCTK